LRSLILFRSTTPFCLRGAPDTGQSGRMPSFLFPFPYASPRYRAFPRCALILNRITPRLDTSTVLIGRWWNVIPEIPLDLMAAFPPLDVTVFSFSFRNRVRMEQRPVPFVVFHLGLVYSFLVATLPSGILRRPPFPDSVPFVRDYAEMYGPKLISLPALCLSSDVRTFLSPASPRGLVSHRRRSPSARALIHASSKPDAFGRDESRFLFFFVYG